MIPARNAAIIGRAATLRRERLSDLSRKGTAYGTACCCATETGGEGGAGKIRLHDAGDAGERLHADREGQVGPGARTREYAQGVEEAVRKDPHVLAPLRLHFLRWVLFDDDTRFMYIGIFDTDFDKYVEDAVMLFNQTGITTVFEQLEGFPEDWRENPAAFAKFAREHQCQSFLEYAEYPDVTATEVIKALEVKHSFSGMLDQMQ